MNEAEFLKKQEKLLSLCPEVDKIIFALKQYLNVSFFRYVKSFPNNEKFIVSNNEAWLKEYFKEKFFIVELADFSKHPSKSRGIHIHPLCNKDHVVCKFWNKNSGIGNYTSFIFFFVKFDNYFEAYNFGITGDSHETNYTFLNNIDVFKHFFLYFKSRGADLLKQAYECRFEVPAIENYDRKNNWLLGIDNQLSKIVMQEMPLLEIYLDDEFQNIALTLKEAHSLSYFLDGYSTKQAADLLVISESQHLDHLTAVLEKLNIKSYNELRTLCHDKNITKKLSFLNRDII